MITCTRLGRQGNLGNQMFQYAALVGIAERHQIPVAVPPMARHRLGDCFDISAEILSETAYRRLRHRFVEGGFSFDPAIEGVRPWTAIVGYFQSERYFEHAAARVRSEFRFKAPIRDVADQRLGQLRSERRPLVGVTVRRGDYVGHPRFHQLWTTPFYEDAMASLRDSLQPIFVVCSDDEAWCREHLSAADVRFCGDLPPYEQLAVLAGCDHAVIANSTFSWWAAWLMASPDATVIAPRQWFGDTWPLDDRDLVPGRWQRR